LYFELAHVYGEPPTDRTTYAVTATATSDDELSDSAVSSATVVQRLANSIVGFSLPPTGVVGAVLPLSGAGGSSEPVVFAVDDGTCVVVGTALSLTGAGRCVVSANQAGDEFYRDAPELQQAITVSKRVQSVTFTAPVTDLVGRTFRPSATSTSGSPVSFTIHSSTSRGACVLSPTGVVTFTGAGRCVVDATQPGDDQWAPARTRRTVTVLWALGTFRGAVARGTAARSAATLPVAFRLTDAGGRPIPPSAAAALASAGGLRATLVGPGITAVTAACRWASGPVEFRCDVPMPLALRRGTGNPYLVLVTENAGTGFLPVPGAGRVTNPAVVRFR
jgi:hypothetical protein